MDFSWSSRSITLICVLALSLYSMSVNGATIEGDTVDCPRLTCSEDLGDGVCFMHSGTSPVEWLKIANCPSGQICDASQEWAWFDQ